MKRITKETLLRIENVSLTYGNRQILKNVNGEIKNNVGHGQVVGLLGPSGIGKTQLFRILSGLQKPTTGTVRITEKNIEVTPGSVGVVAQNYPLFAHRTVISNLLLAGRNRKDTPEKARIFLERFDLKAQTHLYPSQLSGGQRQRIAIIQQLLCSEHFLLMDEPFSGLDPLMIDEICTLITEVANLHELNTIIVITHDHRAAIKVSDILWLMGRDRDENNKAIPGAYIKHTYDLVENGLAWQTDLSSSPVFTSFAKMIKEQFKTL
jgi:polar amino acid transport system ATP-binding protein/sulfate transport system ATP-binding protein